MWKSLQELDLHWHRIVTGKLCYQRSSSLTPFSGSLSADGSDLLQWPQAIIPRCWIFRWYGDRETCCKSERVLRRVSASPREQSEDRSNNGPPSQIWTPLWERISEAPGKAGGCEEVLDCSLWSIGDNGRAPWRLFLFFFYCYIGPVPHPEWTGWRQCCLCRGNNGAACLFEGHHIRNLATGHRTQQGGGAPLNWSGCVSTCKPVKPEYVHLKTLAKKWFLS